MHPDVTEKVLKGYKADDKTFKVHLDGHNFLPIARARKRKAHVSSSSISRMAASFTIDQVLQKMQNAHGG